MTEHEPDYVVVRLAPDLPPGFAPPGIDGRWYDRGAFPVVTDPDAQRKAAERAGFAISEAVVVATDRFEVRDDGAVAQVYEMRP